MGGLLHTKSLTLDGEVTLIGSANMDRRSFELNYENNILFYDAKLTADVRERQQEYISRSNAVTRQMVASWSVTTSPLEQHPGVAWTGSLTLITIG